MCLPVSELQYDPATSIHVYFKYLYDFRVQEQNFLCTLPWNTLRVTSKSGIRMQYLLPNLDLDFWHWHRSRSWSRSDQKGTPRMIFSVSWSESPWYWRTVISSLLGRSFLLEPRVVHGTSSSAPAKMATPSTTCTGSWWSSTHRFSLL